jgi:hypothetical protein
MSKAAEIEKIAETQMKKQGKLTASDDKTEKLADPYGQSKDFQQPR